MAQRNRRRARSGNGAADRAARSAVPGPVDSGEEQLTEAQAAQGRPSPAETPNAQELTAFEEADAGNGGGASGAGLVRSGGDEPSGGRGDSHAVSPAVSASKPGLVGQLVGFMQGSWRELQRVQWPDRPQTFQATGVVLGFVIVAGAFLGASSWAAEKIVNLILYGHG